MVLSQIKFKPEYKFGQMTAETVFPLVNEYKFNWWRSVVMAEYGDAEVHIVKDTVNFTSPKWEKYKEGYLTRERLCNLKKEGLVKGSLTEQKSSK